ncbi:MAG: multidrug efflux SMR transporter [Bacillota bacterium]|nr:multidrug efflux SMR transporter [Bacillota bacterium]
MLNVSRPVAYVILCVAVCIELTGDALLVACNGYEHKLLGAVSILIILSSFVLFSKILHIINIAVAYATWSAVGALISVVIGMIFFDQHLTTVGWISLAVLVAGTIVIDFWGQPAEKTDELPEETDLTCDCIEGKEEN